MQQGQVKGNSDIDFRLEFTTANTSLNEQMQITTTILSANIQTWTFLHPSMADYLV